jgi:DNA (cytosine-5)-methyltransferase 1
MTATAGSLFTGIGGLDLAVEAHGFEVAWQVENNLYCQAVLARHWPDVPRYGGVEEIDWHGVERVDLVTAGFPRQPVSDAGRRKAQADERWLWPEVARCVRDLRPGYVFLENVSGLLSRGMGEVLGDLAALGFDAQWCALRASDVGAPHERERVFILAYANGKPRAEPQGEHDALGRLQLHRGDGASRRGWPLAYAEGEQRGQGQPAEAERLGRSASGSAVGDTGGPRLEVGQLQPDGRQQPALERAGQQRQGRRAEPGMGGGADGLPERVDMGGHRWPAPPGPPHDWEPPRTVPGRTVPHRGKRMKALGNAVVPQQGALAFALLWRRMEAAA